MRGGRRKKWDEKKEIRDHISSYILSMSEAFKALDKEFPIGFLVMKSSYGKKYLKTMSAYWGIKSFTFYADILKCVYHLHRSRDYGNQRRILSVYYNEKGRCYKGEFLMKIHNPHFKSALRDV